MAWTAPRTWVAGEIVTAALLNTHVRDNLKVVYDAASYIRAGSGWIAVPVLSTDNSDFTDAAPLLLSTTDLATNGTLQVRVMAQANCTAAGTGNTSHRIRTKAWVRAAGGATGTVGTNIALYTPAAGGALTTGWKTFDSGWTNAASLTTDISAYAWTILHPRYYLDLPGTGSTWANLSVMIVARVA